MYKITLQEVINEFKNTGKNEFYAVKLNHHNIDTVYIVESKNLQDYLDDFDPYDYMVGSVIKSNEKITLPNEIGYFYSYYIDINDNLLSEGYTKDKINELDEEEKIDILDDLGYDIKEIEIWVYEDAFEYEGEKYSMYGYTLHYI